MARQKPYRWEKENSEKIEGYYSEVRLSRKNYSKAKTKNVSLIREHVECNL